MPFTKLDITVKLKGLCDKSFQDQKAAKTKIGGPANVIKLQNKLKSDIDNEIKRQMKIYDEEEQHFVEEITRLHSESKQLAADVAAGGDLKALQLKCQKMEANSNTAHALGAQLTAHQDFRAGLWSDGKNAALALGGDAVTKKLNADFIQTRNPTLTQTAATKDLRGKIDEFVKRGWDLLHAHEAKGGGGGGDLKLLAKELGSRKAEVAKLVADNNQRVRQLDTMQTFVVGMNTDKMTKDLAKAEFKRSLDYEKQTKLFKSQVKTVGIAVESFKARLGESAKNPKVAPVLAEMQKHLKALTDEAGALERSQAAYNKKIEVAKDKFK